MKKNVIIGGAVALVVVAAVVCFVKFGLGPYHSSYVTTMCVTSNTSTKAKVSFSTLKGTMVYKLKCDGEKGRELTYTASLESGNAKVYYDCDGTKRELFTIRSGEKVDASLKDLPKGKIYVIIETDGKVSDGDFEFRIK